MSAGDQLEALEPILAAWRGFLDQTVGDSHDPPVLELTWMTSTLMRQLCERLRELATQELEHDEVAELERALELELPTHVRRLDPDDWGFQWRD